MSIKELFEDAAAKHIAELWTHGRTARLINFIEVKIGKKKRTFRVDIKEFKP